MRTVYCFTVAMKCHRVTDNIRSAKYRTELVTLATGHIQNDSHIFTLINV